jgi:hypothetical protein
MNKEEEVKQLMAEGMSFEAIRAYYTEADDDAGLCALYDVSEWPMAY